MKEKIELVQQPVGPKKRGRKPKIQENTIEVLKLQEQVPTEKIKLKLLVGRIQTKKLILCIHSADYKLNDIRESLEKLFYKQNIIEYLIVRKREDKKTYAYLRLNDTFINLKLNKGILENKTEETLVTAESVLKEEDAIEKITQEIKDIQEYCGNTLISRNLTLKLSKIQSKILTKHQEENYDNH